MDGLVLYQFQWFVVILDSYLSVMNVSVELPHTVAD